jgi:hypothetical protein
MENRIAGKPVVSDRHIDRLLDERVLQLLPSAQLTIGLSILTQLRRLNSEFANYVPPAKQPPVIRLRETGDPDHFPPGAKHRHTRA